MLQLLKHLLFFLLVLVLPLCSGATYSSTDSQGKKMELQKKSNGLVSYLDKTLIEAGVPEDVRKYLVNISREKLSSVSEEETPEKKELLRKNLYILLIDLASKKPLLLREGKANFSSQGYELTARYFLSNDHLQFLKLNQTFDDLNVTHVHVIFKVLCPMWPWC